MSRLNIARFINGHKPALDALSKVNSNLCVLQEYRRKQIFRTHSTRDRKVGPFTKTVNLSHILTYINHQKGPLLRIML